MKKLGTLALTLTLTGAMALPALAAEEPELVIAPADTGYGQTIVLNGETLDLTGIPGVSGEELLPLRLLAEADHGSAYWDEENNESWFTFGDNRITVKFADNSVWLDDQQVKSTAQVADGITFVEAGVLSMLEGYTVDRNPELDVNRIDITTPNNDPMVKAAYQIREDSGMAFGMRSDNAEVTTLFQLPEDTFEQAICFTSMNTTPDIMVLAKLADGADETAVEGGPGGPPPVPARHLLLVPGPEPAQGGGRPLLVEDGYVFYLIAENADAGEAPSTPMWRPRPNLSVHNKCPAGWRGTCFLAGRAV